MGGVVDGGVGIGLNTSPRRAAIEKAQAELRFQFPFFYVSTFIQLFLHCKFHMYKNIKTTFVC